jgi:hypothetical protein
MFRFLENEEIFLLLLLFHCQQFEGQEAKE